ncbi:MAG: hypothetical protein M3Q07_10540 [Pseudobdellovibrionaceae bacterium]|nr:hypothetical protein [Pseudobdellovibrionaceae bacterium]
MSQPGQQDASSQPDFTAEARLLEYFPFVRLSPLEYLTLRELHGDWIFKNLLLRLKDPTSMSSLWAISFCAVATTFPREELESSDFYAKVTSVPAFKCRREHLRAFKQVFFGSIWKKVKAGNLDLPGWGQSIARQDYERWRALLADRQLKVLEKRAKPSPNSEKSSPKKVNRRDSAPAPVVIRNSATQPKSKPAARNVWRNPTPCEPLRVKRRI